MANLQHITAWVLKNGLRDMMTELVPVLLKFEDMETVSREQIETVKDQLSSKTYNALVKKLGQGHTKSKRTRTIAAQDVVLPELVPLTPQLLQSTAIIINRAPVLQLWATVCSLRLGFSPTQSLALASHLVSHVAELKKKTCGYGSAEADQSAASRSSVELFGFTVGLPFSLTESEDQVLADADKSLRYMRSNFGLTGMPLFYSAMHQRCVEMGEDLISGHAGFAEYERFRPQVKSGMDGFGQKAMFRLKDVIDSNTAESCCSPSGHGRDDC